MNTACCPCKDKSLGLKAKTEPRYSHRSGGYISGGSLLVAEPVLGSAPRYTATRVSSGFLGLFKACKGNQDFVTWIAKFETDSGWNYAAHDEQHSYTYYSCASKARERRKKKGRKRRSKGRGADQTARNTTVSNSFESHTSLIPHQGTELDIRRLQPQFSLFSIRSYRTCRS